MPFHRSNTPLQLHSALALSAESMDFKAYWAASAAVLQPLPGRGILLTDPGHPGTREVLFMVGVEVCAASLDDESRFHVEEISCIDPRGWELDGCAWLAEQVNNPQLIEILLKPYGEVADLYFVHEDFEIRNPTLSECGRFTVEPSQYGFTKRDSLWYRAVDKGTLVLNSKQLVLMDEHGEILAAHDLDAIRFDCDEDTAN